MTRRGRSFLRQSWDTISLAILLIVFFIATLSLSPVASWIPRLVLYITFVLIVVRLVIQIASSLKTVADPSLAGHSEAQPDPPAVGGMSPALVIFWIAGLLLAVLLLGVTVGSALFCFAYLRWGAGESWAISVSYALVLGAGVQLVFSVLLQATLYQGWLLSL